MPQLPERDAFLDFLEKRVTPDFRARLAARAGMTPQTVDETLSVYLNEMAVGYDFIRARLRPGDRRILEIGAGLGLLSLFLAKSGYEVWGVEPGATGFGLFRETLGMVSEMAASEDLPVTFLSTGIEDVDGTHLPAMDFAFSVNVMEHIADLEGTFASLARLLAPRGLWVNTCPNYHIPYEPHFAMPLVPFAPGLTARLAGRRIAKAPDLWASFNFITSSDVKRLSRRHGFSCAFESGVLAESFRRLDSDPEFAKRHEKGPVGTLGRILKRTGLLEVIDRLPPPLVTPMVFSLRPATEAAHE